MTWKAFSLFWVLLLQHCQMSISAKEIGYETLSLCQTHTHTHKHTHTHTHIISFQHFHQISVWDPQFFVLYFNWITLFVTRFLSEKIAVTWYKVEHIFYCRMQLIRLVFLHYPSTYVMVLLTTLCYFLSPASKASRWGSKLNHFKKNLQLWVPLQFLLARFCLKNSHFWNFCLEIITLTRTIRRVYEICHTNFTST